MPVAMQPSYANQQLYTTSPPWQDQALQQEGGPVESSLTRRRREANRLAAQRFRSRKKGYQDSLEERVRVLEGEKQRLEDRLANVSNSTSSRSPTSASPQDVKPVHTHAFDAAAHEANKELRRENVRLRAALEESRREARQLKDEVASFGSYTSRSSASSGQPLPSARDSEPYKRRRTSEESLTSSPLELTPPNQLPTPQEYPFHLSRVNSRASLQLELASPNIGSAGRPHPLPSPSMFLTSHASGENFKLAPLRLPPSPKRSLPSPNGPSPRNGFEILLAVGQEIGHGAERRSQ